MRTASAVLISLSFVAACRNTHGDDTAGPDTPSGAMKIQDVQSDMVAPGSPVALKGVVVTAIDAFGDKKGDIWVEEPEGGPYSGIHVFNPPLDVVATLQPGDIIDLKGAVKDEFALASDTSGNTVTELKAASGGQIVITKVSSGAPLQPQVVDALAIGQMSDWKARAAAWEPWEGVLIQVNNVNALQSPAQVPSSNPDMTLENFTITGDVVVESTQAAFPTGITRNSCLSSVTGVLDYFFDYLLLPRTTGEVATGGSACPPPESSAALCGDGIDNDGNGFSDCSDNSCVIGVASCRMDTTIAALQQATTMPPGGLQITDAYVVALSFNKKNLWVSTNAAAAPWQGIYVFFNNTLDASITVGSKVTVIGKATEFNDSAGGTGTLTELNALAVTKSTGTGTITGSSCGGSCTASALSVDATGEQYESVLVTLNNVAVVTAASSANKYTGSVKQNGTTFEFTASAAGATGTFNLTAATCYTSVTGLWTYDVYNNAWAITPTATGATQAASSCN